MYGNHIVQHMGADSLTFIMDSARAEKYRDSVFTINGSPAKFNVTSYTEAEPLDLLIVAVKYTALSDALTEMPPCIDEHTVIISVMNGITSEKIIAEKFPDARIVYTVAQGMDAMKFGNELKYTQMGNLHVGALPGESSENLDRLCAFFEKISMPYIKEADILYRMWFKFMLNVGINQVCMVYDTTYAGALEEGEANRTLVAAMREVRVIALEEGVTLTEADLNRCMEIERTLDPDATPSMGQDRINRKPSEVEMFAGTVISLAEKHNITVPANRYLYRRVYEIESEYSRRRTVELDKSNSTVLRLRIDLP
jgi:2-dehydropantoate 2-reductase